VNKARRSRVRTYLRKFEEALAAGDAAVAKTAFVEAQSELMRAVTKGVVHKNTGSRKVSRLAAQLKKMAAACGCWPSDKPWPRPAYLDKNFDTPAG
jgi:small subunit ribosomal protein S20